MFKVEARPPLPPFTAETALIKVRKAEDAWNTHNPDVVVLAYTLDTWWRNRDEFLVGRSEVHGFLTRKWAKEQEYRLIKGLWAFNENRIAVRFAYEWRREDGQWFRSYGNENWEFSDEGLMAVRHASINDVAISINDRKLIWPKGPRPHDYPEIDQLMPIPK
jgi:nuclear transport factor 2 (NTF2) superfamily protein